MKVKAIDGFPGYSVSDMGDVFSTMPSYRYCHVKSRRKLAQEKHAAGYRVVHLSTSNPGTPLNPVMNGKKAAMVRWHKAKIEKSPDRMVKRFVHRLVLEAFVGKCPDKMHARHLNGNPSDNRVENLAWGTRSENMMDRVRHGTSNRGERHGMAKVTKEIALKIRAEGRLANKRVRRCDNGGNYKAIAKKYGVSIGTVESITLGHTWAWL